MANLGSGRNAFEDLARLMGGPRSKDAAKITMHVFSVDDNPELFVNSSSASPISYCRSTAVSFDGQMPKP